MGVLSFCVRSGSIMIKTLLAICLVASVKAYDAGLDPITQGLDPITQGLGPITQGQGPVLQGLGPITQGQGPIIQGYPYGKRSADADAYYGYPYAYGVGFGSSTGLDPITQGLDASTQGYAPYAHYGYGGYGLAYGKRSADADAYYGYPYAYGVPFGSSTGLDPITQSLDASTQGYAPYAHYGYGVNGLVYG